MFFAGKNFLMTTLVAFGLIAPLLTSGCVRQYDVPSNLKASEPGFMEKSSWLEKVVAALRAGEGIGPDDDVDAMLAKSDTEIVDDLFADTRFGDTALSFNLYFLGRSVNKLKSKNPGQDSYTYDSGAFASPQALASAQAVVNNGDFFELFSREPALISNPLGKPRDTIGVVMSDTEIRKKIKDETAQLFIEVLAAFQPPVAGDPLVKDAGCNALSSNLYKVSQALEEFGFSYELANTIAQKWTNPLIGYDPPGACDKVDISVQEIVTKTQSLRDSVMSMMADMISAPTNVSIKGVKDLMVLSYDAPEGAGTLSEPLTTMGFWNNLKNSSTNFNRKRSAYVLRTYFCDDLTPINVEIPASHAGNAHASDPACLACHYKLDPMAGLFRYNGQNGADYKAAASYVFDDFKSIADQEYTDFLGNWKNEQGGWKVGYYVGLNKPHSRWKGDQLSDLWEFFKQSKEVKQCLVRRMAEYFMGPDQVYDAGWLDEISKNLKPGIDSSGQFKAVVKSLVTSNTFKQADPLAGKCYDYDSASAVGNAEETAPCEIAYLIKKRCAGCHGDASDLGVDFTTWKKLDDGNYGFVHLNENRDAQLSKTASLKLILERITSTDSAFKMPQGGAMTELEKQTLYKWLDKEISGVN